MWRDLGAEERQTYIAMAEVDKARYFTEMSSYTGPMQVPNTRVKRPADAPKRNISAYQSFSQSIRSEVRDKNPDISNTELSSLLAQMWREASDETKLPHLQRENREREKYQKEMVRWKAQEGSRLEKEKEQRAVHMAMGMSAESFDHRMGM